MTEIAPEQAAADKTEKRWEARAKGELHEPGPCGWCEFAQFSRLTGCEDCPIFQLIGQRKCIHLTIYREFWRARTELEQRAIAVEIHELLVENRERLLEAARKILDEAK